MDDKHKIIKSTIERHHATIKGSHKSITELRKQCDHPEKLITDPEWGSGHISACTLMCPICGELIHNQFEMCNFIQDSDQSINP